MDIPFIRCGIFLTSDRSIGLTAKRIRHASRLMRFVPPGHTLRTLVAQFGIAAVVFAVFALRTPPESLIEDSRYFCCAGAASIAWAGILSIGVACFGASAHAAPI
jgi:hypothetical protein